MPDTDLITASFPSLNAARSTRRKLVHAGFARNSIDIERIDDAFEVSISVRGENRRRAKEIMSYQSAMPDLRQAESAFRSFVGDNPSASLILASLAGFILFIATNRG